MDMKRSQQDAPATATDVLALLTADHRKAKELFEQYEKIKDQAGPQEKFEIARTVCGDLLIHMALEEGLFYPAVKQAIEDQDLVNEAQVEHDGAKDLIRELGDIKPEDPMFDARMKVLAEQIEHHVEEEEKEMFPKVRSSGIDLQALGRELAEARRDMRQRLGLKPE